MKRMHVPKQSQITFTKAGTNLGLVKFDGRVLGFLEKYPDTETEEHPYKAFETIVGQGGPPRVNPDSMKSFFGPKAEQDALRYLSWLR